MKKQKIISGILAVIAFIQLFTVFIVIDEFDEVTGLVQLLLVLFQFAISILIFKGKNNIFSLICSFTQSIVLTIFMLAERSAKNKSSIKKCWFIPGLVSALFSLFSIVGWVEIISELPPRALVAMSNMDFSYIYICILTPLSYILNTIFIFLLGYSFLVLLNSENQNAEKINALQGDVVAYYTDLYNQGAITKEELDKMLSTPVDVTDILNTSVSRTVTTGNGSATGCGTIIAILVVISLIISIITSIVADINLFNLIF